MGKLAEMTDHEVYGRWQERIGRVKLELHHLFSTRRKFRDVEEMFRTNRRLNSMGSQAWEWLLLIWGRDAVMAVRRELDDDSNSISLGRILDEMAARPQAMTRRRYLRLMEGADTRIVEANDEHFTSLGVVASAADRMDDHLDPAGIGADRKALNAAAKPVLEYANRMVAHRTPVDKLGMTVEDIHAALTAMENALKKYYVLLTGGALLSAEAAEIGDDWREAFMFAWFERK